MEAVVLLSRRPQEQVTRVPRKSSPHKSFDRMHQRPANTPLSFSDTSCILQEGLETSLEYKLILFRNTDNIIQCAGITLALALATPVLEFTNC